MADPDHPLNEAEVIRQIDEARGTLSEKLPGLPYKIDLFAYPSGNWSTATVSVLERLGFIAAFTVERAARETKSRFKIPRFAMTRDRAQEFEKAFLDYQASLTAPLSQ